MSIEKKNGKGDILNKPIAEVVVFLDIFDYPPTALEIWRLLGVKAELAEVISELDRAGQEAWGQKNGFYFLPGREELLAKRREFFNLSLAKYKIACRAARLLKFVPGVEMAAICNNFYYKKDSDIDFFIITAKDRLWLARFLVTAVLHFFCLRRHGSRISDRICLSFYVSESHLNLEDIALKPDDPYFYHWLAFLEPIFGLEAYERFWAANAWLKERLPNVWPDKTNKIKVVPGCRLSRFWKTINIWWFNGFFGDKLEALAKSIQSKKMSKKSSGSGVIIGDDILKFHENDRRSEFKEKLRIKKEELRII